MIVLDFYDILIDLRKNEYLISIGFNRWEILKDVKLLK